MTRITPVLHPDLDSVLLPGNRHRTARRNPADVTDADPYLPAVVVGADAYRTAMTVIVPAGRSAARTALEQNIFDEDHRPGEAYGLILRESQEHYLTLLTDEDTVRDYRAGGPLPMGRHVSLYPGWAAPGDQTWYELLPATTWTPGGAGVIGQYEGVGGATVTLFEYRVDRGRAFNRNGRLTDEKVSMVSWHCDRCHSPALFEMDARWENRGPADRQYVGKHARVHALGLDGRCVAPAAEEDLGVVAQVFSATLRTPVPFPASSCAASGGCAQVRHARAVTARLVEQKRGS